MRHVDALSCCCFSMHALHSVHQSKQLQVRLDIKQRCIESTSLRVVAL